MSADPYLASGETANPSSWNRYAYVEGDPVNRYDPTGLYYSTPKPKPGPEQKFCEVWPNHPFCGGTGSLTEEDPTGSGSVAVTRMEDIALLAEAYGDSVRRGSMTDCNALAGFTAYMALSDDGDILFESFRAFVPESHGGLGIGLRGARSGFRPEYQDFGNSNNDQAHHFAYFLRLGAHLAGDPNLDSVAATVIGASVASELKGMFRDGRFNAQDVSLGIAAGMMGYETARAIAGGQSGLTAGMNLASKMRKELCQ